MRISDAFPSKYIKASDLRGQEVPVIISNVVMEQMQDRDKTSKPVVYFQGKNKGLVLNKTNSNAISVIYGDETGDWIGREITLCSVMVEFQGNMTPAIRVKVTGGAPAQPARNAGEPLNVDPDFDHQALQKGVDFAAMSQDLDDEIPF